MYSTCSENKGAYQLCSYYTADLCLCFRIGKNLVSHDEAQMIVSYKLYMNFVINKLKSGFSISCISFIFILHLIPL